MRYTRVFLVYFCVYLFLRLSHFCDFWLKLIYWFCCTVCRFFLCILFFYDVTRDLIAGLCSFCSLQYVSLNFCCCIGLFLHIQGVWKSVCNFWDRICSDAFSVVLKGNTRSEQSCNVLNTTPTLRHLESVKESDIGNLGFRGTQSNFKVVLKIWK